MAKAALKRKRSTRAKRTVKAKRQIVAISVNLEVITPDNLKKIVFGLTKGTKGGLESWSINFELYDREKKTGPFNKVIDLDVNVKVRHNQLAEETADEGLNRPQVEHLITRAAPAAERLEAGKTSKTRAERTIEGTLPKRRAS